MQRNTGWGSEDATPILLGLSSEWLERGPDRRFRVRVPGGAVLNCWGGGAVNAASSGKANDSLVTKVNHFLQLQRLSAAVVEPTVQELEDLGAGHIVDSTNEETDAHVDVLYDRPMSRRQRRDAAQSLSAAANQR